jgi:chromosome segregation ATPase
MAKKITELHAIQRRAIKAWHTKERQRRDLLERAQTVEQEMDQIEQVIYAVGAPTEREPNS